MRARLPGLGAAVGCRFEKQRQGSGREGM